MNFLKCLFIGVCVWGILGGIPPTLGFHPKKEEKLIKGLIRGPFNFKLFWQNKKSRKKKVKTTPNKPSNVLFLISLSLIICSFIAIYVAANTCERSFYRGEGENKQLYKALYIQLPGYDTIHRLEIKVDLRKWAGTKHDNLVAINKEDDTENAEAAAGLALKAAGIYTDCELKKENGHYILYRPAGIEKFFTMKAFYRIGRWKKIEE